MSAAAEAILSQALFGIAKGCKGIEADVRGLLLSRALYLCSAPFQLSHSFTTREAIQR